MNCTLFSTEHTLNTHPNHQLHKNNINKINKCKEKIKLFQEHSSWGACYIDIPRSLYPKPQNWETVNNMNIFSALGIRSPKWCSQGSVGDAERPLKEALENCFLPLSCSILWLLIPFSFSKAKLQLHHPLTLLQHAFSAVCGLPPPPSSSSKDAFLWSVNTFAYSTAITIQVDRVPGRRILEPLEVPQSTTSREVATGYNCELKTNYKLITIYNYKPNYN